METSKPKQLHFVVFPFMAPGHFLPMIDIARSLAQHNVIVTIVTTPLNAVRCQSILSRSIQSGLHIRLVQVQFPSTQPENIDLVNSLEQAPEFFDAANQLLTPVQNLFQEFKPPPNCIISDVCLHYTSKIAKQFDVPRITFAGIGCFTHSCICNVAITIASVSSDSEYFVVPNLPHRVEFTKAQVPLIMHPRMLDFGVQVGEAELGTYGVIVNSFEELEPEYVKEFKKITKRTWSIGPVSLCNKDSLDKSQRGNKASIDEHIIVKWLDSFEHKSVLYVCLGSFCNLIPAQLIELGLGLEESRIPFIWVARGSDKTNELENWIVETGFEERNKEKGLIIRGWAPQLLILSHPSTGGFLTHCGWNSTLEGICAGLPLMTWPLFADQFINEKFVVQIFKIGVRVGVEKPVNWGLEEKTGVLVKKEDVKKAVEALMWEGTEREERRKRAEELGEMAKIAVEEGGSSYRNITLLIQDIMEQAKTF